MPKLVIDKTSIQSTVLPNIQSTLTHLSETKKIIGYTSVPNEFKYKSKYYEFVQNINDIYNKLSNINDWMTKAAKDFNSLESELTVLASLLPDDRIAVRQTIIK